MLLANITQKRTPKPFSQETKQKDPVRKIILKWNKNDRALADIVFSVFLNFHQYLSIHLRMLPSVLKPRHSFLHSFKGKESCLQCSSEEELAMRHPPQILFRSSPSGLCTRGYPQRALARARWEQAKLLPVPSGSPGLQALDWRPTTPHPTLPLLWMAHWWGPWTFLSTE